MKIKWVILITASVLACHGCNGQTNGNEQEMRIGCFADKVDVQLQPVLTPKRACAIFQTIDSRFTFRSGSTGRNPEDRVLVDSVLEGGVKVLANVWSCQDVSDEIANIQVVLLSEEEGGAFVNTNICERYVHTFMQMSFSNATPVWEALLRQNDRWDGVFAKIREQEIQTPNYVLALRREGNPETKEYTEIRFSIVSQWYQETMNERLRKRLKK